MKLGGLQKMTLLDFPGRVACTVFTAGCNFRCPFCHNSSLVLSPRVAELSQDDFFAFLEKRRGLLDGVAITGGEPCLHADLPDLLEKIRAMGYGVKLDTNGCHPELLRTMLERGLVDYVAIDIKNSPAKYAAACGMGTVDLAPIRQSIELLMTAAPDYEFRTTVVAELHEAADFAEIGQMIRGAKRYFLQAFTDRDTVPFEGFHAPAKEDMLRFADAVRPFVGEVSLRGVD